MHTLILHDVCTSATSRLVDVVHFERPNKRKSGSETLFHSNINHNTNQCSLHYIHISTDYPDIAGSTMTISNDSASDQDAAVTMSASAQSQSPPRTVSNDEAVRCASPPPPPEDDVLELGDRADCDNNDDDDNDDDVTVIILEPGEDDDEMVGNGWIDQDSPEIQERRRNVLLRELQRVQRASFIHFMILCLIPTSLLFIVIATVLGEDEECESVATTCEKESRTFISKLTRVRCSTQSGFSL